MKLPLRFCNRDYRLIALFSLASLPCLGCSSIDYRARFDEGLIAGRSQLEGADFSGAAQTAENLIAQIEQRDPAEHADQRLLAMFVLAESNVHAAAEGPFLSEMAYRSGVFQLGEDSRTVASRLAHLVASLYYAGQLLDALRTTGQAQLDGMRLPAGFPTVDQEFLVLYCRHVGAAAMAACGFEDQAVTLLSRLPSGAVASLDHQSLSRTLEVLDLPSPIQAIDYFLAFEASRDRQPPEVAFRLGLSGRMLVDPAMGEEWAVLRDQDDRFQAWYDKLAKEQGIFVSPKYGTPYERGLLACKEDNTPVLEFIFQPNP